MKVFVICLSALILFTVKQIHFPYTYSYNNHPTNAQVLGVSTIQSAHKDWYYKDMLNVNNPYIFALILLVVWDLVWRGLALYKAAGKQEKVWFVALLIVNSLGILPIIYLLIKKLKK
jgi:hypothetical protein